MHVVLVYFYMGTWMNAHALFALCAPSDDKIYITQNQADPYILVNAESMIHKLLQYIMTVLGP